MVGTHGILPPQKINIEPEHDGLEDDFPKFQGKQNLRLHLHLPWGVDDQTGSQDSPQSQGRV